MYAGLCSQKCPKQHREDRLTNDAPIPLPTGLPTSLCADPEGFESLCSLLSIATTKRKQALVNADSVRRFLRSQPNRPPRKGRQSDRLRYSLLTLYSHPDMRRQIWRAHRDRDGDAPHSLLPSLEHAALSRYDATLLAADLDPERLAECVQFHGEDHPTDDWRTPAMAALPYLKAEFEDWASVPPDRKPQVLAAAFAAATLLDDARLLHWAARQDEALEVEYAFLGDAVASPVSDPRQDTPGDIREEVQRRAKALRDAATDLCDSPVSPVLFDTLAQRYADLVALREPALTFADVATRREEDLLAFSGILRSKAAVTPWLADEVESLVAAWHAAYPPTAELDLEALRADIRRASAELSPRLAEVANAQTGATEAEAEHSQHGDLMSANPSRAEREQQIALGQQATKAQQEVLDTTDDALTALRPHGGAATNSSPHLTHADYESESYGAETDTQSLDAGGPSLEQNQRDRPSPPVPPEIPTTDDDEPPASPVDAPQPLDSPEIPHATAASHPPELPGTDPAQPSRAGPTVNDAHGKSHPSAPSDAPLTAAQVALWRAIASGRLGLAYHIAHADQDAGEGPHQPSPDLIAALVFGRSLSGPHDDLAAAFSERVGNLLTGLHHDSADASFRDALNLLMFAAALRPALFATQKGTNVPLLRRVELSGHLAPVYRLSSAVADHAEDLQGVDLDVLTLAALLDEGVWKDRFAQHTEAVTRWRDTAPAARLLFAGAASVWQHWLTPKGMLGELGRLLVSDRAAHVKRVTEIVRLLDDHRALRDFVDKTDRNVLGRRGERITGRAFRQLDKRLDDPRALAHSWLRIMGAKPGDAEFVGETVEKLRVAVQRLAPAATRSIVRVSESNPAEPLRAALICAGESIDALTGLFRRDTEALAHPATAPLQVLSEDLLYVTTLRIDERHRIHDSVSREEALDMLVDTSQHATTLAQAFDARLDRGDLYGAYAVCERMVVEGDVSEEACRRRLDRAVSDHRVRLRRRLYQLTGRLEQAFGIGHVSDDERAELTADIGDAERRLESPELSLSVGELVDEIDTRIQIPFSKGVDDIRTQIEPHLPRDDPREQDLIQEALAASDLATLHEHLDCLNGGQSLLASAASPVRHLANFLEAAARVETQVDDATGPTHSALIAATTRREDCLGLPFSALSPEQASRSEALLTRWFQTTRRRRVDPDELAGFFTALGFSVPDGGIDLSGDSAAVLRTEPLRAREFCPTHAFGSDAGGRYRLVFNWNTPACEPIAQAISAGDPNAHNIVLHFGKLTLADRNWLRQWSIEHPTQFITIDESLVLYLASLPGGALRALFDCTLPFTCTEPYFTVAGLVPPESFFGRAGELRNITDRYGACFVYGGRQLGKTALLHAAAAAFREAGPYHLAHYVDLKYEDVGDAFGADNIWPVLWGVFIGMGIVDSAATMPKGRDSLVDTITSAVRGWLDRHEDGRILLLLDEADYFLEADLKDDFRVSTRLKGLMDQTDRRFKAVLCGLHNVLRNTERANHPLAHLGEPVCVGPLLSNGDLDQARALVRDPMAAVGYEFESENLITQILLWTNYYPSLVQILGQTLLRYLRQVPQRRFPDTITAEDLQAVLARDQFRDHIRDRFLLTLRLDQRYEVIAYAMAFELQGVADSLAKGLSEPRILELAREYWPDAFDISRSEFGTLMQEMCGLGVLRKRPGDGPARFVFRNPNILLLLGDAETILDTLYQERSKPAGFKASEYHARHGRATTKPPRHGPITYAQEALLKRGGRVAVLCGTPAANIHRAYAFLQERLDEGRLRPLDASPDDKALRKQLTALRPGRDTYVYVVDEGDHWDLRWLQQTAATLRQVQRGRNLRVVFRADPARLWNFVEALPDEYLTAPPDVFDWIPALPWTPAFLSRWCSNLELHEARSKTDDLLELTGGWPILLERYASSQHKTWQGKSDELDRYLTSNRDAVLDAFGLANPNSRAELAPLCAWDTLRVDDVEEYAGLWAEDGHPPVAVPVLHRRLLWATRLGLVQDVPDGLRLNPLLARILPEPSR